MKMRFAVAALAATLSITSVAHSAPKAPDPTPTPGPGGDPDPGDDPSTFTPGEDAVAGQTGVGSTGVGFNAVPTSPAGSTSYNTGAKALDATVQGGITLNGVTVQQTGFGKIGQVFNGVNGTLNQFSFVDTNGGAGGEQLSIVAFDPTAFTTVGPVLFNSSTSTLTNYGDTAGAGGANAYFYHTFSNINLNLVSGLQYYAYLTPTAGSQVFNGSNTRISSGAYFFEGSSSPSALGGELLIQFANSTEFRIPAYTPTGAPEQALYYAAITPLAGGGTGAVPEPASWAMMVAGFGLVGGALRRRATRVRFA